MISVFLLWHTHTAKELGGGEDSKLIGVYSSKSFAENAKSRVSALAGFKDHLNGFQIDEYKINQDEWREGFATINRLGG